MLHADAEKFWRSGEDQVFAGIIPLSPRVIGDIEVPQIGSLRDIRGNPTQANLFSGKVYICDIVKSAEFKRYLTRRRNCLRFVDAQVKNNWRWMMKAFAYKVIRKQDRFY
ncbi:hypothetical protein OIU74_028762 [Salix koriyanagi]|uniref:Uncharacterized protein n=1 Tax=Salix koriyanagi TaxID=2511006 RepID=A0A9Q0VD26_9ROSI|nr:hypothetical protein OIU74_028762 [Salix koriyanagi]